MKTFFFFPSTVRRRKQKVREVKFERQRPVTEADGPGMHLQLLTRISNFLNSAAHESSTVNTFAASQTESN